MAYFFAALATSLLACSTAIPAKPRFDVESIASMEQLDSWWSAGEAKTPKRLDGSAPYLNAGDCERIFKRQGPFQDWDYMPWGEPLCPVRNWTKSVNNAIKNGRAYCKTTNFQSAYGNELFGNPPEPRVPVILGFGDDIEFECCRSNGRLLDYCPASGECCDDMLKQCRRKKDSFIRLAMVAPSSGECKPYRDACWSPCKNLEYILCAAQGLLPGQDGNKIFMATNRFPLQGAYQPPKLDAWAEAKPEALRVTHHEVCLLSKVCANAKSVFTTTKENPMFKCDFNGGGSLF